MYLRVFLCWNTVFTPRGLDEKCGYMCARSAITSHDNVATVHTCMKNRHTRSRASVNVPYVNVGGLVQRQSTLNNFLLTNDLSVCERR